MENFKAYAQYYDLLYAEKNYIEEANFILGVYDDRYKKLPSYILDMGCGTGKHAIALEKQSSASITGIDLSSEMIETAKSKCQNNGRTNFLCADVRNYNSTSKFDLIVSLFHVLSYQNSNADVTSFFNTAHSNLIENQLFLFDCWFGPSVLEEKPEPRIKKLESNDIKVFRYAQPEIDYMNNIVNVNYHIVVTDKHSGKHHEFTETHKMRYFFTPEIRLFLEAQGFELLDCFEWPSKSKLSNRTWNSMFVAKKCS